MLFKKLFMKFTPSITQIDMFLRLKNCVYVNSEMNFPIDCFKRVEL